MKKKTAMDFQPGQTQQQLRPSRWFRGMGNCGPVVLSRSERWGIDGGEETNYTVAMNWYLNPALRVMVNYVYGNVEDREIDGTISDADINSVPGAFDKAYQSNQKNDTVCGYHLTH